MTTRGLGCLGLCSVLLACGGPNDGESGSDTPGSGGSVSGTGAASSSGGSSASGGTSHGASGGSTTGGATGSGGSTTGGMTGSGGSLGDDDSLGTLQILASLSHLFPETSVTTRFDAEDEAAWQAANAEWRSTCTTTQYGDCSLTQCAPLPAELPPEPTRLEAGQITIEAPLEETPWTAVGNPLVEDNNRYQFEVTNMMRGQEVLTIKASGGTISAFETTVTAPLAPLLESPAVPADQGGMPVPLPVSRTEPLVLQWQRGETADVVEFLVKKPAGSEASYLNCSFPAADNTGTVPQEALAALPAETKIRVFSAIIHEVETAEGSVRVVIAYEALSPDKTGFPYLVLQ